MRTKGKWHCKQPNTPNQQAARLINIAKARQKWEGMTIHERAKCIIDSAKLRLKK